VDRARAGVAEVAGESRHMPWRDSLNIQGPPGTFLSSSSLPFFSREQAEPSHGVAPAPPPLDPPPPPLDSSGFGWEITH
jgi:hypothetical protein